MTNITLHNNDERIEVIFDRVLTGLDSTESIRQYGIVLRLWQTFAEKNGIHPLAGISIDAVRSFLLEERDGKPTALSTRVSYLAVLRKLTSYLAIHSEAFAKLDAELRYMKVPRENVSPKAQKRPLTAEQVRIICDYWLLLGDTPRNIRNAAFINLTFATGARISEVRTAKFSNILNAYTDQALFEIEHGKGDKYRQASILSGIPIWESLRMLESIIPTGFQYLFTAIKKNGEFEQKDKPISRQSCTQIIEDTVAGTGIDFHHHIARFTLGTQLIRHGGESIVRDVMQQFGHANPQTLLNHYVAPLSAENRHEKFKDWK